MSRLVTSFTVFCLLALPGILLAADAPQRLHDSYISTGDNHYLGQSLPIDSKATIEATFDLMKDLGVRRMYWRGLEAKTWLSMSVERPENVRYYSFWRRLRKLYKEVDPDKLAIEAARTRGMEIWGVATLVDWGSPADCPGFNDWPFNNESRLRTEHPEWVPVDRYGVLKQGGSIEFAYPEARKALIDLHMAEMNQYKYDGMVFLTYAETHSMRFQDEFGYSEPVMAAFKKRHGIDPRYDDFTRFACKQDWYRLRGEFLGMYLGELKAALKKNNQKLGLVLQAWEPRRPQPWNVPELMQTAGAMHLDLDKWVREGTLDALLVYGYSYPTRQLETVRDMVWLSRGTQTQVAAITSGPWDGRWNEFDKDKVAVIDALGEDEQYLLRSNLPMQNVETLKGGQRILIQKTLAQIIAGQTKATAADVLPLVKDANPITRRLALRALGKIHDPAGVAAIEAALEDQEPAVRFVAAEVLRHLSGPQSLDKLVAAVEKLPDHSLVELAVGTVSRLKAPNDKLIALMKHQAPRVREVAARALVNQANEQALEAFKAGLNDEHRFVRFGSAEGLGNIRNSVAAAEVLIAALDHADVVVVNRAATSLGNVAARNEKELASLRPKMIAALKNAYGRLGDKSTRADIEWGYRPVGNALLKFGPEGEAAVREFFNQDQDKRLAEQAWKTLYIRKETNSFSEVTEKENEELMHMRPAHLRTRQTPRLSENFDVSPAFLPDTTGMAGDAAQVGGRWGGFTQGGPIVDDTLAHSGKKSVKLIRGGQGLAGSVGKGVGDGREYQLSLWMHRDAAASSIVIAVKGFEGAYVTEGSALVAADGAVKLRDEAAGAWVDTGLKIKANEWTRLVLSASRIRNVLTASVTPRDGLEQKGNVSVKFAARPSVRLVEFVPQGGEGTSTHIDDVQLVELP